jgi:indolepyruvate ferredoxin oxidoreductase beta subunit
MGNRPDVTNIVVAGLGGQGVLKAADIIAAVAFARGLDVKKSEIHGMSQRGGSVSSDVRFGSRVFSPMVPDGEAGFLIVLAEDQIEAARGVLRPGGVILDPSLVDERALAARKSLNVALLGALSLHLEFAEEEWLAALRAHLPEKLHESNLRAFRAGRASEGAPK